MKRPETPGHPEFTLDPWIKEIKLCWQKIPEFTVDPEKLKHLAVICDGNRRAAALRGLPEFFGHRAGVEVIKGIARAGRQWGIHTLTFWVWSTENWQRDQEQVTYVMDLAERYLSERTFLKELRHNKVRFVHIGDINGLPKAVADILIRLEGETRNFSSFRLNLAMNYGGVDEVARTIQRMSIATQIGGIGPEALDERPREEIGKFLDTAGQPNPDLVIRTGMEEGEMMRTSGFMPIQTEYSVWDPIPELFPDLTPKGLLRSIENFLGYQRRMGR
ncbi:MAG: di-trans,poly-cis-decaprenylcistransferase [Candidatus Blackburnbacteria bacterium]|nr:di-trans,poly-cis-decaprenylcistransferase [Candidatus Blackburnbacteria bacterium]